MAELEATLRLAEGEEFAPGSLGRFQIVRQLGRGGMGIVLEAHDPTLARRVAIKVLQLDGARERDRLEREAQAMAQLSHPNVVIVYEVGWVGDRAFLAMECVDGGTLRHWQAQPRTWREIVKMYVTAGRGLAAAHAAGLAHRDFKPDNVLVGRDGRPRVTDFGLASHGPLGDVVGDVTSSASVAGRAIGTPAYMAPEAWEGAPDELSDQFAFSLALWEALAGKRPFAGADAASLRACVMSGELDPAAALPDVPRRLEAALRRGLARRAADRWVDLTALLDELERVSASRRRWRWVAVVAVLAAAVATAFVLWPTDDDSASPPLDVIAHSLPAFPITSLGGCAYMPAFLDDDTVAFDHSLAGAWDLYTMKLGEPPTRRTSDPGGEWGAAAAAPGRVSFIVADGKGRVDELTLATGKRSTVYAGSGYPAYARGDYYLARSGTGDIIRVRDQTQEVVASLGDRGNAVNLVAAPDGSRLAAFGYQKGIATLCFVDTATAAVTCRPELTEAADRFQRPLPLRPAFSADSRSLYYAGPRAIFRVPVAGGAPVEVRSASTRGGIAVSPSGTALAMSMCTARSSFIGIGAALPGDLANLRDIDWPALAPDGSLAYVVNQRKIVLRSPSGATRELVVLTDGAASELTFSADGSALAYQVAGGANAGIFELNVKTPVPNRVTAAKTASGPMLVPGAIVFTRKEAEGSSHVAWSELSGGEHDAVDRARVALAATPDGRVLVATPARDHFYWWDRTTGVETPGPPLVLDREVKSVRISPSGTWLVARVGGNGTHIYRLSLSANTSPELVRELSNDYTTSAAAIDDAGTIRLVASRSEGELEIVYATSGARW